MEIAAEKETFGGFSAVRIVSALSGDLLLTLPDGEDARDAERGVAEALGIRRELVRATVTECSVVVLSGQILCRHCGEKAFCSCKAPAACDCEVLEDPPCAYSLCEECDARDRVENAVEDERQRQKDEGRWW